VVDTHATKQVAANRPILALVAPHRVEAADVHLVIAVNDTIGDRAGNRVLAIDTARDGPFM
jgi:hypothetical protein